MLWQYSLLGCAAALWTVIRPALKEEVDYGKNSKK